MELIQHKNGILYIAWSTVGENKVCRFGTMFSTTDANLGGKSFAYKFHYGSVGYTVPCLIYECTPTYISLHKKFYPFLDHI